MLCLLQNGRNKIFYHNDSIQPYGTQDHLHIPSNLYQFGHHRSLITLKQSAVQKCYICNAFWQQLFKYEQERIAACEDDAANLWEIKSEKEEEKKEEKKEEEEADTLTRRDFVTRADIDFDGIRYVMGIWHLDFMKLYRFSVYRKFVFEPSPVFAFREPIASCNTLSEQSFEHAERWLHDCRHAHRKCNSHQVNLWYPTRLLYLDSNNGVNRVRLVHTDREPPCGPYFTLSHRWCVTNFVKLTRHTLASFGRDIPLSNLPKTFVEAILVTLRLGIRYLWIDSLCIIQDEDDFSDWSHEASLMHKVYSHSLCNISASARTSTSEGLSRTRIPSSLYGPTICLRAKRFNFNTKLNCKVSDHGLWAESIAKCHLNTRGWVFQERILAPRILHFCDQQLFWECRQHRACESYPGGHASLDEDRDDTSIAQFKTFLHDPTHTLPIFTNVTGKTTYYQIWTSLVAVYSTTSLTNPLDKLIALSGIAKQMSLLVQDIYVAGMWRGNLENDLLWHMPVRTNTVKRRPCVYQAPSWSWASINDPVQWSAIPPTNHNQIQIVDVVLEHATEDIMGRVTNGWLDLKGELKPMTILWREKINNIHSEWEVTTDTSRAATCFWTTMLDVPSSDAHFFDNDNETGRLFYVPVSSQFAYSRVLLLRVVDEGDGVFERIGSAVVAAVPELLFEALLHTELGEDLKQSLPCLEYRDGLHTIRII